MDKNKVIQTLKNYRSYKFAIQNGIAHSVEDDMTGMPMAFSYGSRPPQLNRGSLMPSINDHNRYRRIVALIDGAMNEVLSDKERMVIKRKYTDQNTTTLFQISQDRDNDERTVGRWHKSALHKLGIILEFADIPEIINLDEILFKMSG